MSDMHAMNRRRWIERLSLLGIGACAGTYLAGPWRDDHTVSADEPAGPSAEQRVKELKLELPPVNKPGATLVPAVRVGNMLYLSGQGPRRADGKPWVGKVGQDVDLKEAQQAARAIGLSMLATVRDALGSLNKVVRVVKTLGMVNATPDYTQQPQVINGFSDLMVEVFGAERGKGARSAVGVGSLPGGIPVEIEIIYQVRD